MKTRILFLMLLTWLTGCASNTIQTDQFFSSSNGLKPVVTNAAPFINQEAGHCGPATLAMAIGATGNTYDLKQITDQVYSPNAKGSLQEAMIASARRQGFVAIQITGLTNLLKELESGYPVIVFENLGINWAPQWHYALITGYDLERRTLTLHSGPNPNDIIEISEFELSWKLANYWGLVILRPDELSTSADEVTHLRAAAALEKIGKYKEAKMAYLTILKRWPKSLIARIGLGNIYYNLKQYQMAVRYLQTATELYPKSKEAKTNLQIASQALRGQ
ncbi:MAG: PA2778 family cysteine peptidase [Pseudobdellovibrio sp.]|nr:PA2778 family cysteine peptidase [Pseudobdellovibrio sp.]